jgi:hypothetical protein
MKRQRKEEEKSESEKNIIRNSEWQAYVDELVTKSHIIWSIIIPTAIDDLQSDSICINNIIELDILLRCGEVFFALRKLIVNRIVLLPSIKMLDLVAMCISKDLPWILPEFISQKYNNQIRDELGPPRVPPPMIILDSKKSDSSEESDSEDSEESSSSESESDDDDPGDTDSSEDEETKTRHETISTPHKFLFIMHARPELGLEILRIHKITIDDISHKVGLQSTFRTESLVVVKELLRMLCMTSENLKFKNMYLSRPNSYLDNAIYNTDPDVFKAVVSHIGHYSFLIPEIKKNRLF